MRLPKKVHVAADGSEWIKWCGLLVNVASLQMRADYTRYAGSPLSDALTLPLAQVSLYNTSYRVNLPLMLLRSEKRIKQIIQKGEHCSEGGFSHWVCSRIYSATESACSGSC